MLLLTLALVAGAGPTEPFQPLTPLVGSWKGTGTPDGTKAEREAGFWSETIEWAWQFKKDDAALVGTIANGKHFAKFELRYLAEKKQFQLTATKPDKTTEVFLGLLTVGKQKEQLLTVARTEDAAKQTHRLVFTLLHANRYLYRYDVKPAGVTAFARKYQVGATKQGEPFAEANTGPECVVSGGQAKIPVVHNGKTYYVCCSGCKDAFKDDPEKFIKALEAKKK